MCLLRIADQTSNAFATVLLMQLRMRAFYGVTFRVSHGTHYVVVRGVSDKFLMKLSLMMKSPIDPLRNEYASVGNEAFDVPLVYTVSKTRVVNTKSGIIKL